MHKNIFLPGFIRNILRTKKKGGVPYTFRNRLFQAAASYEAGEWLEFKTSLSIPYAENKEAGRMHLYAVTLMNHLFIGTSCSVNIKKDFQDSSGVEYFL